MPGVPSGRGCEACRKQRKKCDRTSPACSRCTRLSIPCIGAGVQRYKFHVESGCGRSSQSPSDLQVAQNVIARHAKVPASPVNAIDALRSWLVAALKPSTDARFNLWLNYGAYIEEVPQALGVSESLDAAAHAVICAHEDACLARPVSCNTIMRYLRAIRVLRLSLDDPVKAQSSETLCAIMLLLTCQGLAGISEGAWTGHCEGAVSILRARGSFTPRNDFDRALIATIKGPIVVESILNNKLHFTPIEMAQIMEVDYHIDDNGGARLFRCLSQMPAFMRRAKAVLWHDAYDPTLVSELKANHAIMLMDIDKYRKHVVDIQRDLKDNSPHHLALRKILPQMERALCMCLCMGIISCCVLGAIDPEENRYPLDSSSMAEEIVRNSQHHEELYPLGAGTYHFYMTGAWIGTNDETLRASLDAALAENRRRSNRELPGIGLPTEELSWVAREVRLQNPPQPGRVADPGLVYTAVASYPG